MDPLPYASPDLSPRRSALPKATLILAILAVIVATTTFLLRSLAFWHIALFLTTIILAGNTIILGIIALIVSSRRKLTLLALLLALLSLSAVPIRFVLGYSAKAAQAKEVGTMAVLSNANVALAEFAKDNGRLPTAPEGLDALLNCPPGLATTWRGSYVARPNFNDSWGHPLIYIHPGPTGPNSFDLFSPGPDANPGTPDDLRTP